MSSYLESLKEFLPKEQKEGFRGFYPCLSLDEYRNLPLPMRCSTWDKRIKSVVFDSYFSSYGLKANIYVHPEDVFKALYIHSKEDTQLYSVCYVIFEDGTKTFAKWIQDSITGCYAIVSISGNYYGKQGGFNGHIPANCYKDNNTWKLNYSNYDKSKGICCGL